MNNTDLTAPFQISITPFQGSDRPCVKISGDFRSGSFFHSVSGYLRHLFLNMHVDLTEVVFMDSTTMGFTRDHGNRVVFKEGSHTEQRFNDWRFSKKVEP